MNSSQLKLGGLYRHYKGKMYKVHQIVRHSETLEELVLYETLYENPAGRWWVRPATMFMENVVIEGKEMPRFAFVGEAKQS